MWDNWKNTLHNWKSLHEKVDQLHKLGGLRIWILHVLSHGPKNGVEIMDSIQEHYEGMYKMKDHFSDVSHSGRHYNMHLNKTMKRAASRPSPGSIYPMLKKMVAEDLITKMDDGKYDLTDTGRETIYEIFGNTHNRQGTYHQPQAIESALMEIDNYISYLEDIKKENLSPHKDIIESLNERFSKIKDSLDEN
ncbi:MAG: helix-turn-helix transcriptional regulator [Methanobacteriaceae archaeon]|nr:helix-turn-helix transcriptional regulator [Methanobacteriaceae archaeon]MDP2836756.1 helix-turn-helix transcriptional regulator [Methanobacteriaceae archaeon]MDP3034930.1 helix-turn-helix transcriptional regulator [Methanobacteriaceae archaeon]MDP3485358.1 helix-turn-helix transcriptional regulator [Methanobacteriaceae archaeon]MDP3622537.1 helix-turn-helix transcriptional regulator [Methanobacteriaceae archaeon]